MKKIYMFLRNGYIVMSCTLAIVLLDHQSATAQSCPAKASISSNSYPNTYYPASQANVPAGSKSIIPGAVTYGSTPISSGGALVLYATHNIVMNSQTVDASGLGFRGGGGRAFDGVGSGSNADFITPASSNANGSKEEGISGTPKYLNHNNSFLDVSGSEGYPNGSYGKGAPGNAGGGGTDGKPASSNDENTGGGGGSGTTNNVTGTPSGGFASSVAAGGGIIILMAGNALTGTGTVRTTQR